MRRATNLAIAACSFVFIIILGIAAYWDSSIRVLHAFESLPYVVVIVLSLSSNRFGYPLGFASGAFWLWTAGFLTSFVRNGFERLVMLVRTGSVDRVDILIAAPAAMATGGLVLLSLIGYVRQPAKSPRDLALLLIALLIVPAFFIAIFAAFAPQYLGMFTPLIRRIRATAG
jgi:hypothetical protein